MPERDGAEDERQDQDEQADEDRNGRSGSERNEDQGRSEEDSGSSRRGSTLIEALNLALHQAMAEDDTVLVMGEDVGEDEGIFRVTADLLDTFGPERVMDTPVAESGILGVGVGMAAYGLRPVCEIQFSGFNYLAYHQLESHASRLRWRSRGRFTIPLVARMPYGGGIIRNQLCHPSEHPGHNDKHRCTRWMHYLQLVSSRNELTTIPQTTRSFY